MRLDKYLADAVGMTRTESARAIRGGAVAVDGAVVKKPAWHVDEHAAAVTLRGTPVGWQAFHYVMLHKPAGTVSTTDPDERSVMRLIPPELSRHDMFPCGRLDVDTEGLLLITDDGALAHELLSPRHHAEKVYFFRCDPPLTAEMAETRERGVLLDGEMTKPAAVSREADGCSGTITLTEGKFHQIKRMLHAVGSEITYLRRMRFGTLVLDENLAPGECRALTDGEIGALRALAAAQTRE